MAPPAAGARWEGKGQAVFLPGDKALIRSAFLLWANAAARGYMVRSLAGSLTV